MARAGQRLAGLADTRLLPTACTLAGAGISTPLRSPRKIPAMRDLEYGSGAAERPLLCNEIHFHEDDPHFDRFQKLIPAFGGGKLTAQAVARIIFRTGLDVAEALILEAELAVPAPVSLPTEQFELWDEFVAQAREGAGRG